MEFKGIVKQLYIDIETNCLNVVIQTERSKATAFETLKGKDLRVKAVQWRNKRSLDANAYYWLLLSKLAEVLNISKPCAHNMMLRKYGQVVIIDGKKVHIPLPDTDNAEETALEASTYHLRPTSQVIAGTDGIDYRTYQMLKGSSEYDTREMHELINGLISDCNELMIETISKEELDYIMSHYKS